MKINHKIKTLLALLLAPVLLLPLCACGASEEGQALRRGTWEEKTYTNDFIGIGCVLGEEWTVYDEAQLLELSGIAKSAVTDEEIAELMEKSAAVYDMYAYADNGLRSINIVLEKMGVLRNQLYDEARYLDESVDQLVTALESMGMESVTTTRRTVTFAGLQRESLLVNAQYGDSVFQEEIIPIPCRNYMAAVTFGNFGDGDLAEMESLFYGVD